MCPRRYGCVFWVEKRLRDASSALAVQETDSYISSDDKVVQVLKRSSSYGPREYLYTGTSGSGNSALLELIHLKGQGKGKWVGEEKEDSLDLSSLSYYTRAKGGVVPCESPLGPPPRMLAF